MRELINLMLEQCASGDPINNPDLENLDLENPEFDTLEDVLRTQILRDCQQQLAHIQQLEETITFISDDLHVMSKRGLPDLKEVKPLQEQARVATSLIRGYIYLADMRDAAEQKAWGQLNSPQARPLAEQTSPDPEENKSASAAKDTSSPPQDVPSLARMKKNLVARNQPKIKPAALPPLAGESQPGEKNKSQHLETISRDLLAAQSMLATMKEDLLGSSARPAERPIP